MTATKIAPLEPLPLEVIRVLIKRNGYGEATRIVEHHVHNQLTRIERDEVTIACRIVRAQDQRNAEAGG